MNTRHDANEPPPAKEGWEHSEQVLVYYDIIPELNYGAGFGIAYYHYFPPYKNEPEWVDFSYNGRAGRVPKYWWTLPSIDE